MNASDMLRHDTKVVSRYGCAGCFYIALPDIHHFSRGSRKHASPTEQLHLAGFWAKAPGLQRMDKTLDGLICIASIGRGSGRTFSGGEQDVTHAAETSARMPDRDCYARSQQSHDMTRRGAEMKLTRMQV